MAEESLERRIARLESRAEIAELLARYAFLIDDHEFDALGELFTPDARFLNGEVAALVTGEGGADATGPGD